MLPKSVHPRCGQGRARFVEAATGNAMELKICVPTYYGETPSRMRVLPGDCEFGNPYVPVLAHEADGLRIVLGSHELYADVPDIAIERRAKGWAVFLHPVGLGDPSGYVYFLDDGRSFLVKENGLGPTPAIKVSSHEKVVARVDGLLRHHRSRSRG